MFAFGPKTRQYNFVYKITIKLIDFATCHYINNDGVINMQCKVGATEYLAPEIIKVAIKPEPYFVNDKIDIYALGLIILFIIHNKFASDIVLTSDISNDIRTNEDTEKYFVINANNSLWLNKFLEENNHKLNYLIKKCCEIKPEERCAIKECMEILNNL